jgi:putative alpha-1,2-mannosidase
LFSRATIHLPNGKTFTVNAIDNSRQNKYIQSGTLNGKPLNRAWFTHDDLVDGGELVLQMGSRPNKEWGMEESPPSLSFSKL